VWLPDRPAAEKGDPMTFWIIVAVVAALALYVVYLYNRLVSTRQMSEEAWSGIDVQLKRRSDLIPNLVDTVKGYATHERGVLEEVTELRNQARAAPADDVQGRGKFEGALSMALGRLLAVAEAYPDLKASENFVELQRELANLESEIQMARRYYNGAVRNLNTMVESFPSNLVAGQFRFEKREYFEIEEPDDRAVPKVSFQG
jgi:LemA protein